MKLTPTVLAMAAMLATPAAADFSLVNTVLDGFELVIPGPIEATPPGETPKVVILSDITCFDISIGDISLDVDDSAASRTVATLAISTLNLKCDMDSVKATSVPVVGSVSFGVEVGVVGNKNNVALSLGFESDDFNTKAPEDVVLDSCNAVIDDLDLKFRGASGFLLNLVRGVVEKQFKSALSNQLCPMVTDMVTETVAPLVRNASEVINSAEINPTIDFLAGESVINPTPEDNVFSFKESETISGFFDGLTETLNEQVDGKLKANSMVESLLDAVNGFFAPADATIEAGQLYLSLGDAASGDEPLFNMAFGDKTIQAYVPKILISGLNTLKSAQADLAGDYTALLGFEQEGSITIAADANLRLLDVNGNVIVEDTLTASTGLVNAAAQLAPFLAMDKDDLGNLQVGSIYEFATKCALSAFYALPQVPNAVGVSDIINPSISGFQASTGIQTLLNDLVNLLFGMFEPTVLAKSKDIGNTLLANALESVYVSNAPLECPYIAPVSAAQDNYFDFANEALYKNATKFVSETVFGFLEPANVAEFTKAQSGEEGVLFFEKFSVNDLKIPGSDVARSGTLSNLRIKGLDTVANLAFLELVGAYSLKTSASIATAAKPFGVAFDLVYSGEETLDVGVAAETNEVAGTLQLLVQAYKQRVLARSLLQLQNQDCWIALGEGGNVGVEDFSASIGSASLTVDCRSCPEGIQTIANDPAAYVAEVQTNLTNFVNSVNTKYNPTDVVPLVADAVVACSAIAPPQPVSQRTGAAEVNSFPMATVGAVVGVAAIVVGAAAVVVTKKNRANKINEATDAQVAKHTSDKEVANPVFDL